jgi:hypothetical protein
MSQGSVQQNGSIYCVIFTYNTRIHGYAQSNQPRLIDLLNTIEPDVVRLQNVEVRHLSSESEPISSASVFIPKDKVILAFPLDEPSQGRESTLGSPSTLQREARFATLELGPFTIHGRLYLIPGGDPVRHIRQSAWPFLAVIDAIIASSTPLSRSFQTPFVVINRNWIDAFLETA